MLTTTELPGLAGTVEGVRALNTAFTQVLAPFKLGGALLPPIPKLSTVVFGGGAVGEGAAPDAASTGAVLLARAETGSEADAGGFEFRNPATPRRIPTFEELQDQIKIPDRVGEVIDSKVLPVFEPLARSFLDTATKIDAAAARLSEAVRAINEAVKITGLDEPIAKLSEISQRLEAASLFPSLSGGGGGEFDAVGALLDSAELGALGSAGAVGLASLAGVTLTNPATAGIGITIGALYFLYQLYESPVERAEGTARDAFTDVEGYTSKLYEQATPKEQDYIRNQFESGLHAIEEEIKNLEQPVIHGPYRGQRERADTGELLDKKIKADQLKLLYEVLKQRYERVVGGRDGAPAEVKAGSLPPPAPGEFQPLPQRSEVALQLKVEAPEGVKVSTTGLKHDPRTTLDFTMGVNPLVMP